MSDTNPTRAAVYTRVSTGRQAEEGYSLDEQERRALEHIERQGWTPAGCFREEGVSGAKARRPELDRLLAGLDAIDVIVVSSLDRLGRSTVHLLALYDQLERAGVRLVSLREAIDTSTPVGRLLRTVLAAVAEFERDLGRERTSAGIGGRARETGKPWGTPAYGYRKTVEGHWEPDPVEAPVLQRIFAMRTELGMAKAAIARQLNRDGVPTRKGARWSATVVSKVLSGREGLGEFRHGGEWHQGRHAALIDEQQWTAAQAIDERGRMYAPGAGGRLPKAHLFVRGMLRCSCGEAMLPRSARDQADHYVCRTHKLDAAACPVPPVRRDVIDAAALRMFEEVALDVEATRLHLTGQLDARAAETAALGAAAAREVAELAAEADRVERDYRRGVLPAERYVSLCASIAEERAAADAERIRLDAHAEAVAAARIELDAKHHTLARLAELRAAIAARVCEATPLGDIGALRAALAAVCAEVRLSRVEDGAIVLDYVPAGDDWRRVGLGFDAANNVTGSGVPL